MNPLWDRPLARNLALYRRVLTGAPSASSANCGSEPIAAANLGADQVAVFAKSIAQCADLDLQILFRDNDAWPHPPQKFVFAHQRPVGFQQSEEEIERSGAQLYRRTLGNQLALA